MKFETNLLEQKRLLLNELERRKAAASNFTDFCRYVQPPDEQPAKHHVLVCDTLNLVVNGGDLTKLGPLPEGIEPEGKLKRAMIFMPPGMAKSTYASVNFPAYYLGRTKNEGVITGSYSKDLAASFGRRVRNLVSSQLYQNAFPGVNLAEDSRAKGEWNTTRGGFYFACGVDSAVTGRRADLVDLDDIIKGRKDADSPTIRNRVWDWYLADVRTRMKPGASIVLIKTRWHEDGPSGRILPETYKGESGWIQARDGEWWYVINIPAEARAGDPIGREKGEFLWPEYASPAFWKQTKATQDSRNWLSLYQQTPTAEEGVFFTRSMFKRYNLEDRPKHFTRYMTGDLAVTDKDATDSTPDFTELATWEVDPNDDLYAVDWWTGQKDTEVWSAELTDRFKADKPLMFVSEGGVIRRATESLIRKLMVTKKAYTALKWLPHIGDKVANVRSFRALCENGKVFIPNTDWGEALIDQLLRFPGGRFDDKVDACGFMGRIIEKTWEADEPPKPKPPPVLAQGFAVKDLEPKDNFMRPR